MELNFREITEENWIECILLTTNEDGRHTIFEPFVASNAVSIAQSKVEKGWTTKAIYDGIVMVGFTMYGYNPEHSFYEICRLMIDHKFQQKGYGKRALQEVIAEMQKNDDCKEIYLSFEPKNTVAQKLYESVGFENTSQVIEGELLYKLQK